MDTEAALLAAIAANPDDDLPRLVYADWLDENDRPVRAEFIRLQIEIAHKEVLPRAAVNAFAHLWRRQQEILDGHKDELLSEPLNSTEATNIQFRRGFVSEITIPISEYTSVEGKAIAALLPIPETVWITDAGPDIDALIDLSPEQLNVITGLSLSVGIMSVDEAAEYMPGIPRLRTYSGWPRLRVLDLENCRLGREDLITLFTAPCFPSLTDLDLSFNDLTDAGVIDLLSTGLPQRLKRLVLGGNPIGDQAAMELADRLGQSKVLENLNLRMTNIGGAGQAAITQAFGSRADLF